MKLVPIALAEYLRMLVYGKPGSGKTTFCASLGLDDRTSPVLHIDCGGNPEVVGNRKVFSTTPNVTILQPDKLDELNAIYDWLEAGQPNQASLAKWGLTPGYKTVVFDGFTDIQRQSFDRAMSMESAAFYANYPKREFKHYGFVLQQLLHMISELRKLKLHVIVTTLEHTKTLYEVPGEMSTVYNYYSPMLDGEGKRELPGYVLSVMRMQPKPAIDPALAKRLEVKHTLGSFEHNKYQYGKDQFGFPQVNYADPTITKLLDSIDRRA